jgi:hypothetical protein
MNSSSSKQQFLNFLNNNILGDISVCVVVLGILLAVLLTTWKINGFDNSNVILRPNYNEYWIQQMMPPLLLALLCFVILFTKVKLRNFIAEEFAIRCHLQDWITVIE